jgi:4-amino-4-deoxy-L-arabinose transferase-like glycosyltransferase
MRVATTMNQPANSTRDTPIPLLYSPWAMVAAALALRLVVMCFAYKIQLDPAQDHWAFGWETGRVARSIATGHGFSSPYSEPTGPTALIPPVYTYLVAGVFKLFGIYSAASAVVLLTLNNIFSSLTCLPVFLIARRVFGSRTAAWSGWTWALFPYSIALSNTVVWETSLTTFLFALLVLSTLRLENTRSLLAWSAWGLLWGFTALASPAVLSTLPFLGMWVWLRHWQRGSNCTGAAIIAALLFFVVVAPWIWRCSEIYGRFVAFRSNFGLEVLVGNSSDTSTPSNWKILPGVNSAEIEKLRNIGEPAYMAQKQQEAKELIKENPGRYAALCLRRIIHTWTGVWQFPPSLSFDSGGLPDAAIYSFLSLFAFIGLAAAMRNRCDGAVPLTLVLFFFPGVYYLTHSDMGFRHPIDTIMVMFAVYGLSSLNHTYKLFRKPHNP